MRVVGRAQQQQRRRQRTAGHHDDVGRIDLLSPFARHMHRVDCAASRIGAEPGHVGVCHQGHVRVLGDHRIDAHHLRVGLAVKRTREAVEVAVAYADAGGCGLAVFFVEQDAQRQVEGFEPDAAQMVRQLSNLRLVADWWMRIRAAGPGFERILAALPMHLKQRFGLRVIRLEHVIAERPCRRHAAGMLHLAKVAFAQPEQGRAVNLRIAADVVVQRRAEGVALGVGPGFIGLVDGIDEHCLGAPVQLAARQVVAALKDQDAFARSRHPLRQRRAAGPAADDDQVVMISRHWRTSRKRLWHPCSDRQTTGALR